MGVNVFAPLLGVRAALPHLIESRGAVVLTGSFATYHASGGGALYTASKHAVLGLVRQLAYEFAPDVRVNTLLASDQSRAMTGTMVPVDSGLGIRGLARPGGRVRP